MYDLPTRYLSISQIDKYLSCGLEYKYEFVDKIKEETSAKPALFGKVFHHCIAGLLASKHVGENLPSIRSLISQKLLVDCDGEELIEDEISMMERFCNTFIASDVFENCKVIALEKKVVYEIDGIQLIGYIDAIIEMYGEQWIIDFKAVRQHYSPKFANESMQLTSYAYPTGIRNVAFITFSKTAKTKLMKVIKSTRSDHDIEMFEQLVKHTAASITRDIKQGFKPRKNFYWKCKPSLCNYWNICTCPDVVNKREGHDDKKLNDFLSELDI